MRAFGAALGALLLLTTACQEPALVIDAVREEGYEGGVEITVCDPQGSDLCTQPASVFVLGDAARQQEVAIFFDEPPRPFEVDLVLDQQGGTDACNQGNRLPLQLEGHDWPVRFGLEFRKTEQPLPRDYPVGVCGQLIVTKECQL